MSLTAEDIATIKDALASRRVALNALQDQTIFSTRLTRALDQERTRVETAYATVGMMRPSKSTKKTKTRAR
jgi:hypothetical protein